MMNLRLAMAAVVTVLVVRVLVVEVVAACVVVVIGPVDEVVVVAITIVVDVVVTPDAVSSDAKSGLAWVPDLQPLAAWDDAERRWRASFGGISRRP